MRRKYYFFIILMLCVIYFTNGRPTEIADRIMIHAIGIDREEHGYKVTMQSFTPEASGSETSIDPSKPNVSIVSGRGDTVNDAVRSCFSKLGGNVFIGQNQIIIFGKNIDFSETEDVFGFFLSSSETFLNVDCAMSESTAEEILKIPISGSTITSEKYPQMIESAEQNGRCIKTTFMDLLNGMESHDRSAILPVFSQTDESKESGSGGQGSQGGQESSGGQGTSGGQGGQNEETLPDAKLVIKNGAIFKDGKFAAEITYEQMGIAGMLGGSGKYIHTEIKSDERDYSKTYKLKSREVTGSIKDGEIVFRIEFRVSPKDSQMFSDISQRDRSNREAKKLLEKKAQSLADDLSRSFTPELLGADFYMKRFFPDIYRKYADSPEQLYEHVRFEISIE